MKLVEEEDSSFVTMATRYSILLPVYIAMLVLSDVLLYCCVQYEVVVYDTQSAELSRHIPERGAVSVL